MPPRKPSPSTPSPVSPLHIRPDARALDALQRAQRATGGALSAHRVALAALTIGARIVAERPAVLFELAAEGAEPAPAVTSSAPAAAPAAPPAPAPPPPAAAAARPRPRPRSARASATAAGDGPSVGVGPNARAKASPVEVEAASTAIRRARAAGHGTAALLRAARVQNTGGARETLRDLAADPRPVRTFTRALVLSLAAGAHQLAPDAG